MKNKGFTLVELLAVIAILAIIALIVVPVVVNIIDDAKSNSEKRSLELYGSAVENAAANYRMDNIYTDVSGIYMIHDDGKTLINASNDDITITVDFKGAVNCKTAVIYPNQSVYLSDESYENEAYGVLMGDVNLDGELNEIDYIVMKIILSKGSNNSEIQNYLPDGKTLDPDTINEIEKRIDVNGDGLWTIYDLGSLNKIISLKADVNLDGKLDQRDADYLKKLVAGSSFEGGLKEYLPKGLVLTNEIIEKLYQKADLNGDGRITISDINDLKSLIYKVGRIEVEI